MNKTYYSKIHLTDVSDAVYEVRKLFPEMDADPIQDFGSGGAGGFLCSPALAKMAVHPKLLSKVRSILQTDQIRLVQSVAWAKYGQNRPNATAKVDSNNDQRMHMDYGNNMYGMPLPGEPLAAVAAIIYYSDTEDTGGGTAIVPRISDDDPVYKWPYVHMPGISGIPFANDRETAEKLMDPLSKKIRQQCYDREIIPTYNLGDVLLYRLDTWHRGTPVKPGKVRYTHNLLWKRADNTDIQVWNKGFTQAMYSGKLERFIGQLAPDQLETLGFPLRNSKKWKSSKFCQAMYFRYGWAGLDLLSYVKTPDEPPKMPEYWPKSNFTMIHPQSKPFREDLFKKLAFEDVYISLKNSNWEYQLEYIQGPHYIKMEAYFFKLANGDTMVDINRVQGDRGTFFNLRAKIQSQSPNKRFEHKWPNKTPLFVSSLLKNETNIDESLIYHIGEDAPDDYFMPFLSANDLNIVRIAIHRLKNAHSHPIIKYWNDRIPRNFMESKIHQKAKELWKYHSCL